MDKNRYRKLCEIFREVLTTERKYRKISQKSLSEKLGVNQTYISKTEIGERRLDVIELFEFCDAMGVTLTDFVFRLENRFMSEGRLSPERKRQLQRWLVIYKKYYEME